MLLNDDAMQVLLITSSVNVNAPFTSVNDTEVRLEQYSVSIERWIRETGIRHIVVCDNSGFKYNEQRFEEIAASAGKQIEFVSFQGNTQRVKEQGKGYGEGEIIEYALMNSNLMRSCKGFYKITGRIFISNFNRVSLFVRPSENCFNLTLSSIEDYVDTRFYHCEKQFYLDHLLHAYVTVNDNENFVLENAFSRHLKNAMYGRFLVLPDFDGISGSTGVTYKEPRCKYYLGLMINFFYKILGK